MTDTALRYVKADFYDQSATEVYTAVYNVGSTATDPAEDDKLHAWTMDVNGNVVRYLGGLGPPPISPLPRFGTSMLGGAQRFTIFTDPNSHVGDNSVFCGTMDSGFVWQIFDFGAAAITDAAWTTLAVYGATGAVTPVAYDSSTGLLYWCEWEEGLTSNVLLRSVELDLSTNLQTISSTAITTAPDSTIVQTADGSWCDTENFWILQTSGNFIKIPISGAAGSEGNSVTLLTTQSLYFSHCQANFPKSSAVVWNEDEAQVTKFSAGSTTEQRAWGSSWAFSTSGSPDTVQTTVDGGTIVAYKQSGREIARTSWTDTSGSITLISAEAPDLSSVAPLTTVTPHGILPRG